MKAHVGERADLITPGLQLTNSIMRVTYFIVDNSTAVALSLARSLRHRCFPLNFEIGIEQAR